MTARAHDTQHQADRLKKLIEANQALAQVESLSDLLPRLLNLAQEVSGAMAASILLYKPDTDTLEFTLAINDAAGGRVESILKETIELKMGEGIAGTVAQSRESVLVQDAQKDKRWSFKADEATGFSTKSLICAPVLHKDTLLGVVQVLNPKNKDFFDQEDLLLLESFGDLAAVAIIRSKLLEASIQQERMQVQLETAARIQSHFLPQMPDLGHGSSIWAITKPAIFVGGDFYDCITMDDGSIIAIVADVSGKGLPAALIGATLWAGIRGATVRDISPAALLKVLNEEMFRFTQQELFTTMVVGRFWPENGRIDFALAGHIPPIVVTANGPEFVQGLSGPPLGVDPYSEFAQCTNQLEPGQACIFLTDGVSEARNEQREFFEEQRILSGITELNTPPYGKHIVGKVEAWLGSRDANDDITLLEIWRT